MGFFSDFAQLSNALCVCLATLTCFVNGGSDERNGARSDGNGGTLPSRGGPWTYFGRGGTCGVATKRARHHVHVHGVDVAHGRKNDAGVGACSFHRRPRHHLCPCASACGQKSVHPVYPIRRYATLSRHGGHCVSGAVEQPLPLPRRELYESSVVLLPSLSVFLVRLRPARGE